MGLVRVKTILLLLATTLIATAITTTKFAGHSIGTEPISSAMPDLYAVPNSPGNESADEPSSNIRVVLVAIGSEGFEPAEMQLSSGEYLFVMRNRTGLDAVNLRLVNENSQQILAARVGLRRQDLKRRLHLGPGTYRLTETDHSDWTCTLVVSQ